MIQSFTSGVHFQDWVLGKPFNDEIVIIVIIIIIIIIINITIIIISCCRTFLP